MRSPALIVALVLLVATPALAQRANLPRSDSTCVSTGVDPDLELRVVTYYGPYTFAAPYKNDLCDYDTFGNCTIRLRGLLHTNKTGADDPGGTVLNRPLVIYNHGHERDRGEACALARFLVRDNDYVMFQPLRRGHTAKSLPGIRSTGTHIDDYIERCPTCPGGTCASCAGVECTCSGAGCQPCYTSVDGDGFDEPGVCTGCSAGGACATECTQTNAWNKELNYLHLSTNDVDLAVNYMKSHPAINATGKLIDPERIFFLGHSFGGSLTIFANGRDLGQQASVGVSPGALSWNDVYEARLTEAMADQKRPFYVLQPKNETKLDPVRVLPAVAIQGRRCVQAGLFPEVPIDPNDPKTPNKQAHEGFIGDDEQVDHWGPSVLQFFDLYSGPGACNLAD
jgi:hypothetical protein